ncbi:MAG: FadR family transcriptional regulator [Spirochaetaceae bacterium]|nr:MAG: FadR family transcriptional regulator [Spirochaetaceae bacterium]
MNNELQLDKIKQKTVVEQVMDKIRELISSGQFQAGDKIPTESELAEMFGIGRSSIREAIKVFNYLGVLQSRTAKGTYVCERSNISDEALTWSILLGRDDYYHLIDMRGAIELWSMMSLADRYGTDPESVRECLSRLEVLLERMRQAIAASDSEQLATADYDFHSTVIGGSDNKVFTAIYQVLRSFMYEEIEKSHQDFTDITTIIQEHREFIDAIRTGKAGIAEEIVRKHIASIKRRLANVLKK